MSWEHSENMQSIQRYCDISKLVEVLIVNYDMLYGKLYVHTYFRSSIAQIYLVNYLVIFKKDAGGFQGG